VSAKTLTLKDVLIDVTSANAIFIVGDATIIGMGEVIIKHNYVEAGYIEDAIVCKGNLTIEGTIGDITSTGSAVSASESLVAEGRPSYPGTLTIKGTIGNITANGIDSQNRPVGTGLSANGNVTVSAGAEVGNIDASVGIYSDTGSITIAGMVGDIIARGEDGIHANGGGDVVISGKVGDIQATGAGYAIGTNKNDFDPGSLSGDVILGGTIGKISAANIAAINTNGQGGQIYINGPVTVSSGDSQICNPQPLIGSGLEVAEWSKDASGTPLETEPFNMGTEGAGYSDAEWLNAKWVRIGVVGGDTTLPTVVSVTPSGTGTALSGNVVITFSEAMDTGVPNLGVHLNAGSSGGMDLSGGALTISATETATTLTVKANSTLAGYTTVFGSATVTVTQDIPSFVAVTDITGVPTTKTAGASLVLSGTVAPSNATNQTIAWSIVRAGATGATISGNTLTATAAGTVTVRATIADGTAIGTDYTKDFSIAVSAAPITTISVTGVSLNRSSLSLYSNTSPRTGTLTATVSPTDATDKAVTWSSSNTAVATVDQSGNVSAVSNGTATITVTTTDGSFTASCTVTVTTYTSSGGGNNNDGGSYTPPSNPPTNPPDDTSAKDLPGGSTVDTPEGQDYVDNDDGSTTLPGGGTITTPGGNEIEAPPGTNIADDGTITFPPDSGGAINTPSGGNGNGGATINVPPGTVIDGGGKISFPSGSGGGTITDSFGNTFNMPEDAVIILDMDTPLGYFIDIDNPYGDVRNSDWYYNAVLFAYSHGLMNGASAAPMMFSPNAAATRSMTVTVLYRMAGSPDVSDLDNPFGDVEDGTWYTDAVKWAAANGIVSGVGGGLYDPNAPITRQDLAVILARYADLLGISLPSARSNSEFIDDADIANYAKEAIERFFRAGIIGGYPDGGMKPQGEATRAEVAAMMMRFLEAME